MLVLTALSAVALSALLNVSIELLRPLWYSEKHNIILFGSKDNILKCVNNDREYYADIVLNCALDKCVVNNQEYCARLFQYKTDNTSMSLNFQINRLVIIDTEKKIVELVVYNIDNVCTLNGSQPWYFDYHPASQTIIVSDVKIYSTSKETNDRSMKNPLVDYNNLIGSSINLDLDLFTSNARLGRYKNDKMTSHLCDIVPSELNDENNSFLTYSGIQYNSKMLLYFLEICKINLPKIRLSEQIVEYDTFEDLIHLDLNYQIHLVTEVRDVPTSIKKSDVHISTIEDYLEIINEEPIHYYSSIGMSTVISDSFFCDHNLDESQISVASFFDTIDVIYSFWRILMNPNRHTVGKSKVLHVHALFPTSYNRKNVTYLDDNNSVPEIYERKKHLMNKKNYPIAVSDGLVHVLLFVLPEQLQAAQEIVHSWRHNCFIKHTCAMYSRYYINLALPNNFDEYLAPQMLKGDPSCNRKINCSEILEKVPSIRSSILQVEDIVNYFVTPLDVVVVLIGMEAIRSFPQPAASNDAKTLIPYVSFGGHAFYGLKNDIVFGNGKMKTIAGVGTSIKYMLRTLQRCEKSSFSRLSDSTLSQCFDQYIVYNPEVIVADDKIFNAVPKSLHPSNRVFNASNEGPCLLPFNTQTNAHQRTRDNFESIEGAFDLLPLDGAAFDCSNFTDQLITDITSSVITYVRENIPQGRWDSCCSLIVRLYNALSILYERDCLSSEVLETVIHDLISKFVQLGLSSKYYNFMTSVEEYKKSVDTISTAIFSTRQRKSTSSALDNIHNSFVEAAWSALANIYQELGPVEKMSLAIASSTSNNIDYNQYQYRKNEWFSQRNELSVNCETGIHIITAASDDTSGLRNLRLSAFISGVRLNVVGLGRKYDSYYDKILWYYEYLHGISSDINDDHVVVLIDAYDVLLFPSVRRIGKLLRRSRSPIVACTEHGSHPEMSVSFLYPRGHDVESNLYHDYIAFQKYLNSGCIAGRAGQMKELLHYAKLKGKTLYDDQMLYIRYMLARPDQIHLDINSQIFLTTHAITKQQNSSMYILPDFNLIMVINKTIIIKENIAVLHANNMGNIDTSVYGILSSDMVRRYNDHFSGPDGVLLLQVLHSLWDSDYLGNCAWNTDVYRSYFTNPFKVNSTHSGVVDHTKEYLYQALDKLKHPIIVSNMTKNGGRNSLGENLLQAITLKIQECII